MAAEVAPSSQPAQGIPLNLLRAGGIYEPAPRRLSDKAEALRVVEIFRAVQMTLTGSDIVNRMSKTCGFNLQFPKLRLL